MPSSGHDKSTEYRHIGNGDCALLGTCLLPLALEKDDLGRVHRPKFKDVGSVYHAQVICV